MIIKSGKHWLVKDSSGKKILGRHPSKEKAVKQLAAIEISKKKRGVKEQAESINNFMNPTDNYFKLKCADLYEQKKILLNYLRKLDEDIASVAQQPPQQQNQQQTQQSVKGMGKRGKKMMGQQGEEQPQDPRIPVQMQGFAGTPQLQAARLDVIQRYSDNPMTQQIEEPGEVSWQNVNASIGNERQEALRKLMIQQRMA